MLTWLKHLFRDDDLHAKVEQLMFEVSQINANLTSFLRDELHPARKAASDALGRKVMDQLVAEDKARRHTTGEL